MYSSTETCCFFGTYSNTSSPRSGAAPVRYAITSTICSFRNAASCSVISPFGDTFTLVPLGVSVSPRARIASTFSPMMISIFLLPLELQSGKGIDNIPFMVLRFRRRRCSLSRRRRFDYHGGSLEHLRVDRVLLPHAAFFITFSC